MAGASLAGLVAHARAQGPGGLIGQHPPPVVPGRGMVGPGGLPGPTLDLNFINGAAIDPRISYTGSGGTLFNQAGAIVAATTNTPRFDYDPVTHLARGLLIEEARTNLLLNSAVLATQSVTTAAVAYALSFYGTGTVVLSGAFAGTLVGTGAFPTRSTLLFTATAGTLTATVTGSVLNAQLEAGAFASSAILSGGTAGVRAADVATMPVGAWFNATLGAWVGEIVPEDISAAHFIVGGASGFPVVSIGADGKISDAIRAVVGLIGPGAGPLFTVGAINKTGFVYQSGNSSATLFGTLLTNAATFSPATGTLMTIGGDGLTPGAILLDGWCRRVRYWPRALSNAELQGVTT